jgi:hypothetical protein
VRHIGLTKQSGNMKKDIAVIMTLLYELDEYFNQQNKTLVDHKLAADSILKVIEQLQICKK